MFLGIDPGLTHLGFSGYDPTTGKFDINLVYLQVKNGRLYKLKKSHFKPWFEDKCRTTLKHLLCAPIKAIGIEYQAPFFKKSNPQISYLADIIYHTLRELLPHVPVHWICPKKWRKVTRTEDSDYDQRKFNSWNSKLFANLADVQRYYTHGRDRLEDGLEAALIAYCTGEYLSKVEIFPGKPTRVSKKPPEECASNPSRPELMRFVTPCTHVLDIHKIPVKTPIKKPSRTKTVKKPSAKKPSTKTPVKKTQGNKRIKLGPA